MVDRLLAGANRPDPSICTRVYTRHYMEYLVRTTGGAAVSKCRKDIVAAKLQVSLIRIEQVTLQRSHTGQLRGTLQLLERVGTNPPLRLRFGVVVLSGVYRIDSGKALASPPKTSPPGSTGT
jgi:hypothetical protein